ncbi:cytochrome c oxidase subunit II [Bacillus piscicola]|uniref:cytochrome c oxidase subunit II n=1 Tax=Bacillus piscicola TaxID=1632684 RepID=UPI001F0972A6|nr:cytochrome c oxidase subunit II [Bacillus piscicola]
MKRRYVGALMIIFLFLSGCQMRLDVLNPAGDVAAGQRDLIVFSLAVMMIVVIVVAILFIWFLWKYRAGSPIERKGQMLKHSNRKLEIAWTVLPVLLLALMAVPMLIQTYNLETKADTETDAMQINVTGHRYWWQFDYPNDNIRTAQELHLPANEEIIFHLESSDVIHSFWIPQLGGKKDAIPGQTNQLYLKTGEPGIYEGKCAELCGASHAGMRFQVIVHEEEDFKKWKTAVKKEVTPKEGETVSHEGKRVFQQNCLTCHAADGTAVQHTKGPNLTLYGDREKISAILPNDEKHLKEWIQNPEKFKPSIDMPSHNNLSEQELNALVDYLHSLRQENVLEGRE